jgi:hypothetical protein
VTLYDETKEGDLIPYVPKLTSYQDWLWHDLWMPSLEIVKETVSSDRLIVVHLGDATHGNGHPEQLMGTREADQRIIAGETMHHLVEMLHPAAIRLVKGTSVHEFGEGSSAVLLSRELSFRHPELDVKPLYHWLLEIDTKLVDCSHHGPTMGARSWLTGNMARYYLRDIQIGAALCGESAPDLVLRGHVHGFVDEVVTTGKMHGRIIICPSLCGLGDYARKATRSVGVLTNGMVLVEISGGRIADVVPLVETLDLRTKERF